MPHISTAAQLASPVIHAERPRLEPPSHLGKDEQALFAEIVTSCAPDHFVPSDLPLLISYVQSTLLSRRAIQNAFEDGDSLTIWEKSTRMQAMLATRLRLAPQARTDPKTIARHQPRNPHLRAPWED
jgi:hypothetical protein